MTEEERRKRIDKKVEETVKRWEQYIRDGKFPKNLPYVRERER